MSNYDALITCYRSGQISEKCFLEHMSSDKIFAEYAKKVFSAHNSAKG